MMRESDKRNYSWFIIFCLLAIVAIVACNLWSLYWGHCAISDFLEIPPIGWLLIGANFLAALVFFSIKRYYQKKCDEFLCSSCAACLREAWLYCPNCGDQQGS
jgi:hypothetical protein